jgi:hypothetical protein
MTIFSIFFDAEKNFQWASIAAIIALIAALLSAYNVFQTNRKNFENIVSKSRIEWIQEVRKRSVDFMSSCYELFKHIELKNGEIKTADVEVYSNEINKNGTLLMLYFGPSSDKNNEFMVFMIGNILERVTHMGTYYDVKEIPAMDEHVRVLRDFLRIYIKTEWKRANGSLKDSEVQADLEKQELYKDIMEIFSEPMEAYEEWNEDFYIQIRKRITEW